MPCSLEITFEVILPERQQHDQRYTKHSTVLKFLAETTTMPSETNKRLRVNFCRSSKETKRENHMRTNTWFLQVKVPWSAWRNFADFLKDQEQPLCGVCARRHRCRRHLMAVDCLLLRIKCDTAIS